MDYERSWKALKKYYGSYSVEGRNGFYLSVESVMRLAQEIAEGKRTYKE